MYKGKENSCRATQHESRIDKTGFGTNDTNESVSAAAKIGHHALLLSQRNERRKSTLGNRQKPSKRDRAPRFLLELERLKRKGKKTRETKTQKGGSPTLDPTCLPKAPSAGSRPSGTPAPRLAPNGQAREYTGVRGQNREHRAAQGATKREDKQKAEIKRGGKSLQYEPQRQR